MVQPPDIPEEPGEQTYIGPVWISHKNITFHIRVVEMEKGNCPMGDKRTPTSSR
jgi:hypothetical protein